MIAPPQPWTAGQRRSGGRQSQAPRPRAAWRLTAVNGRSKRASDLAVTARRDWGLTGRVSEITLAEERAAQGPRFRAPQAWAGLALIAIFWPANWCLPGLRTAYLFFPLWLGYILLVDGLVRRRTGTSLWTRSRAGFAWLFVLSAPGWWLFELINARTKNWEYLGAGTFSSLEYFLLCTLSFSTVMPAVFGTAALVRSFAWVERLGRGRPIQPTPRLMAGLFVTGLLMLTATLVWPRYCYPFVWTSVALMLEAVNWRLGRPHLLEHLRSGDWRAIVALGVGALICGFFWEMWNLWSYPKWIYHTPGVEFWKIFEMPLLGYGGYIPFALELYGLKHFLCRGTPEILPASRPLR